MNGRGILRLCLSPKEKTMRERSILFSYFIPGTLAANHLIYCELPYPWVIDKIKASAVNDSDATLAVGGGVTVTATVIGDGGQPEVRCSLPQIHADELVILTLDYDGASGTAAQQVSITVLGYIGESA